MLRQQFKFRPKLSSIHLYIKAVWVLVLIGGILGMSEHASALSEKNLTGGCRTDFNKWKNRGGYGAFALGTNSYCGYSWDNESLAIARDGALSACVRKGKGCTIISENNTASPLAQKLNDCFGGAPDVAIMACTGLMKSGKLTKVNLAIEYNNRGFAHDKKGEFDLAVDDYTSAIKILGTYGLAYSNRARREYDIGQYQDALIDFRAGLKYYAKNSGTFYDYRSEDQAFIGKIETELSAIKNSTDDILCTRAMTTGKLEWDQSPRFSSHVKEAKKRGLDITKCQAILTALQPKAIAAAAENQINLHADGSPNYWADCKSDDPDRVIKGCNVIIISDRYPAEQLAIAHGLRGAAFHRKRLFDFAIIDFDEALKVNPNLPNIVFEREKALMEKGGSIEAKLATGQTTAPKIDAPNKKLIYDRVVGDHEIIGAQLVPTEEASVKPVNNIQPVPESADHTPLLPPLATGDDEAALSSHPRVTLGKRVALVVGNSSYEAAPALTNPRNDMQAMGHMLSDMGFEVIGGLDLKKPELETKIREFSEKAQSADLSLFYYAGHGLQVAGQNYLVPVDARLQNNTSLDFELINLDIVTNHMGGERKVGIVLLDACRDNPFVSTLARSLGTSRSATVSQGLAPILSQGGGLVIAYATAPGAVASDGNGSNSPFATALLKELPTKGVELELIMKRVKKDVIEATNNQQRPWTNSDLSTEVYLQPIK